MPNQIQVKDKDYFEARYKSFKFYWNFLELTAELDMEILEELKKIRALLEKK
jgi:hypothetical protein